MESGVLNLGHACCKESTGFACKISRSCVIVRHPKWMPLVTRINKKRKSRNSLQLFNSLTDAPHCCSAVLWCSGTFLYVKICVTLSAKASWSLSASSHPLRTRSSTARTSSWKKWSRRDAVLFAEIFLTFKSLSTSFTEVANSRVFCSASFVRICSMKSSKVRAREGGRILSSMRTTCLLFVPLPRCMDTREKGFFERPFKRSRFWISLTARLSPWWSVRNKSDARSPGPWRCKIVSSIVGLVTIRSTARGFLRAESMASLTLHREHGGKSCWRPSFAIVALLLS